LRVSGNTIRNVFNGITVTGYNQVKSHVAEISTNTITLALDKPTSTGTVQTGINVNLSYNLFCTGNTVTGPALFALPTSTNPVNTYNLTTPNNGLNPVVSNFKFSSVSNGTFNIVQCNTSAGGCHGFEFAQASNNLKWQPLNRMNGTHYFGMLLNVNGQLPAQFAATANGNIDNEWNFTPSTCNTLVIPFQKHTFVKNSIKPNGVTSILRIKNPNNTIFFPGGPQAGVITPNCNNGASPNTQNYEQNIGLLPSVSFSTPICLAASPAVPAANIPQAVSQAAAVVANNSYTLQTSQQQLAYVAQKNLYNAQKTDNLYIFSDPALQTFFNTADAPASGYKKLWDIEAAISADDYSTASNLIAAFSTNNEIEINYKTFYSLYIDLIRYNNLTIANQNALKTLANLCPHTQGSIIYSARSLYNGLFTADYQVFMDNCDGPGLYKKASAIEVITQKPSSTFIANVYPNPSDGNVYVQTNLPSDEVITIIVSDISGKLLQTSTCATSNSGCYLNMLNFTTGFYFVTIQNMKHEKIIQKICIQ
jgi:Secretion system C-terminal sorting domain